MRAGRPVLRAAHDPSAAHALGELLTRPRDELQLAAAARTARGARLRRLARGLPPAGDGPLAAVLGAAGAVVPGLSRALGVAAAPRPDARALSSAHAPGRGLRRRATARRAAAAPARSSRRGGSRSRAPRPSRPAGAGSPR